MSCGCSPIQADRATLAAICTACKYADHSPGTLNAIQCTVNGCSIGYNVARGSSFCPIGKHPDASGVVRWLGIRWYGVPYPIRLALWALHAKHPKPTKFSGCGCAKRFKDLHTGIYKWLHARLGGSRALHASSSSVTRTAT